MGAARPAPCSHAARLGAPRPWPGRSAKSSSSSAAAGSSHGSGAPSVSRLCLSAAPAVDLERGPRGCPGPEPPGSLVGSRTGRRGGDAEGRGLQPGAAPPNASPAVGAGMRGPQDPSRSGPSPPRPRMRPVALVQVQRGLSAERDLQTPQAGAEELRCGWRPPTRSPPLREPSPPQFCAASQHHPEGCRSCAGGTGPGVQASRPGDAQPAVCGGLGANGAAEVTWRPGGAGPASGRGSGAAAPWWGGGGRREDELGRRPLHVWGPLSAFQSKGENRQN
uniref:translation initiation factor IF-2-like isoform X1 n=1 Tax=Callithrix jacchus TaxID=9483 RepID=UPI0023DCEDAB|nr:translation initiation factor IF-2-like isoform X1 [Callithrix jacchus]